MNSIQNHKKLLFIPLVLVLAIAGFLLWKAFSGPADSDSLTFGAELSSMNECDKVSEIANKITTKLNEGSMSIFIKGVDEDTLEQAVEKVYDNPLFFWLDNGYRIMSAHNNYIVQFDAFYEDKAAKLSEVDAVVDEIIAGMDAGWDDYEKVKYVHDTLCQRITYKHSVDITDQTIYGALVKGECVCEGYTKAFLYVMNRLGYETLYFSGMGNKGENAGKHSWNGVYLDGELYYFDLTWDDNDEGAISYNYFGVTSADISRNHSFDQYHPKIDTSAEKYNYFIRNGYQMEEYSEEALTEVIRGQGDVIDMKCSSLVSFYDLLNTVKNPYLFNSILTAAGNENSKFTSFQYIVDEDARCVRVFF